MRLASHTIPRDAVQALDIPEQRLLDDGRSMFPLALQPAASVGLSAADLAQWCRQHRVELRSLAMRHCAILFRGCGVHGPEDFAAVVRALECEGYTYVGGAAPRTELVPGVVFTSNESPPDQPIPFHHELAQSPTPPAYILFHCERESSEGGATPIIPSVEVAAFCEREFPDLTSKMEALGVRYIRVMPEVTDATSAQGRSWKETYAVETREEAEAVMRRQGTSWEWLPNGDCRTVTAALPALRYDKRTGRRVFFNSVIAAFTGWNDSRNTGEKAVVFGDFSPMDRDALWTINGFMAERRVAFKWKEGDVLFIDNTLAMHARETFVPPRRVLAALCGPPRPPPARRVGLPLDGEPLRFGIIGTGAMGKEHIRNLALLGVEKAYVVAVSDSNERARAEAEAELGPEAASWCTIYANHADLLARDDVDAVIVCTPNYHHINVLRLAIPTGKHILCEKPLCTTVEDCREVEALVLKRQQEAAARGERAGIFMTGMEYRWMPPIARLVQEADSGDHGDLRVLTLREHRFPFLQKVDNWNRFNRYTGGTLVEKACHFFDLMRRIIKDDPVSVYASGGQAQNHKDEDYGDEGSPDIIDHALVVVEFANGVKGFLDLCMFAEDTQTEHVSAVFERAKVEAASPDSTVKIVRRQHISRLGREPPSLSNRAVPEVLKLPVPQELAAAGYHEGATYFELEAFCMAAMGETEVPVTARDGRMAVAIGVAAHESMRKGEVVRLDSGGQIIDGERQANSLIAKLDCAQLNAKTGDMTPSPTRGTPTSRL